jgi:FkbM family methyltransferase
MVHFFCPNFTTLWRAETMLTKDPDTIKWIDSFQDDAVFMDIGANIGVFSIYAAIRHRSKIYAFEPDASNYYILNKNIEINNLNKEISAYCIGLNNVNGFGLLNMEDTSFGSAVKEFSGRTVDVIKFGDHLKHVNYTQGSFGLTVDSICSDFGLDVPHYIKIDVDGIEEQIIEGAIQTLQNKKVKSVVVELETADKSYPEIIRRIESTGLKLKKTSHGPDADHSDFKNAYNHFFYRI